MFCDNHQYAVPSPVVIGGMSFCELCHAYGRVDIHCLVNMRKSMRVADDLMAFCHCC